MKCYSSAVSPLIVLFLSSFAAAQAYSVASIGTASPRAIDSNGNVAGVFETSKKPRQTHAFYWTKKGGLQDLGTLGGNGDDSAAFGINASGQVVGQANSAPGAPDQAFLWSASTGMVDLGNLGGPSSVANAINASGEAAGQSDLSSGFTNGFFWTNGGGLQSIGILQGGQQSGANAINSSGEIAGWANVNSNDDAVVWTSEGGLVNLGITAKCGATAFGINDSAEVVGWFNNSAGCTFTSHGFSWTESIGFKDLGVLPGAQYSFAYSVNSSGQIVGTGNTSTPSTTALLWTSDGKLQDLNTLIPSKSARTLVSANAINYAGQIVADATAKNGKGSYAVLLTPIMNTSLGSSENPSQAGQAVTFTATVQSIAGPPPSGEQVSFFSGATLLGSASLAKGVASFTTSSLAVGTHKIVATYSGDAIYASSKSPILAEVVTK
ncbi:MAG: Ig-like domain repeat protein [Terriglobales bacterium]|jgi:probable HAF family extracellular repeat protein